MGIQLYQTEIEPHHNFGRLQQPDQETIPKPIVGIERQGRDGLLSLRAHKGRQMGGRL